MKKFYFVLAIAVLFAAYACESFDSAEVDKDLDDVSNVIVNGEVSLERAMSNADFVYNNIGKSKVRKVQSIDVLTSSDVNGNLTCTRYASVDNGCDNEEPLAYVVNYENNAGYAILAANTQLPPVISIGDSGSFSTTEFIDYTQNNVDNISPAREVQYAVIGNSLNLPSVNLGNPILPSSDTVVVLKCLPLTPMKWNQTDPYNYYAPIDDNGQKCMAGCVPVAGAQAFASLCYHHNWRPTTQISQNYAIDWYKINRLIYNDEMNYSGGDYSNNSLVVASLIRAVGEDVNADYGYDATSAATSQLVNTCSEFGMSSASFTYAGDCSDALTQDLFDMIVCKNYPVITSARRDKGNGETVGHAFLLDGWLRLEYGLSYLSEYDDPYGIFGSKLDNKQYTIDLVHTNFGWGGVCDGYYLPDAFNLTEQKYNEYAEENDMPATMDRVYDLNIGYLLYEL